MDLLKTMYSMTIASVALLLLAVLGLASYTLEAAELNTQLPAASTSSGTLTPVNIDLPSQPLDASLKQLARTTGMSVAFDSKLATGKTAPAVKGRMKADEALKLLLAGSGLESSIDKDNAVIKPAVEKQNIDFKVDAIEVRAKRFYEIGPLPGLGLTKDMIPGNVQSISAKEIKETNSLSIADLLNRKLQSVTVNDYQGNPFQMDVQYRGFTAGPQIGTPQGLSVFFDGIRVNEPFGDVVNWDMIPMNAIANIDVFPGSNPIFGLNTLGGAFTIKTKDGFNNTGVDANILTGSFGRKQLQAEGGWNNGTVAGFAAANIFLEDGWRDNSPSKVNQVFGKGSYRGDKLDLNLTGLVAWNDLVGNGLIPNEMYQQNRNGVFTSPDNTDNRLWQGQLSGSYFVNDNFTITGQVYRRISKRKNVNSDVYTEYGNTPGTKNLEAGDQLTCLYTSTNSYGLPDYYLVRQPHNLAAIYADVEAVAFGADPADHPLFDVYQNDPEVQFVVNGMAGFGADVSLLPADALNKALPDYYVAYAQYQFNYMKNQRVALAYVSQAGAPGAAPSEPAMINGARAYEAYADGRVATPGLTEPIDFGTNNGNYYLSDNGNGTYDKYVLIYKTATNSQACAQGQAKYTANSSGGLLATDPVTGAPLFYDGSSRGSPGMVAGVPTALITETEINQFVNGASVQFNWNFDKHKFMVGAAIDSARADYGSGQRLGFFDARRHAYLDPAQALDAITAADREVRSNDFDGTSVTRSLYLSETWSPVEQFHLTGALRYNATKVKNTLAAREFGSVVIGLHNFTSEPDTFNICNPGDPCITGYKVPDLSRVINAAETEKFSYYSLNPSLGANWQATPEVNVFGNIAQGTRTPSVIELGCALDKTPVNIGNFVDQDGDGQLDPTYAFKSIAENRSCSLPNTLSGDPYLPQIKATTFDVGMKGSWGNNMVWNLGLYRTDLKDDIYMVTLPGNRSFFDTIGKTRRQGFEAGLSGKLGKATFHLNYSLTDATFQDSFVMASDHNSSATENLYFGTTEAGEAPPKAITVKPGNRMPGVALHNINASVSYEVTDQWSVGLSTVVHSESYIRGNENNQHRPGAIKYVTFADIDPATGISRGDITEARPASNNPGKLPGYATVNFHTKYQFTPEWSASLMVVNILDKEYYTAGRLGVNPFSPSIRGAIGPDGYNHNSYDWLDTTFLSPGAPRAAWFTLRYEFKPGQ